MLGRVSFTNYRSTVYDTAVWSKCVESRENIEHDRPGRAGEGRSRTGRKEILKR